MTKLTIFEAQQLQWALEDVIGYLTDTSSCCHPECCDKPFFTEEHFSHGNSILTTYGLEVTNEPV